MTTYNKQNKSRIKVLAYAYQFQEMFLSKDIFLIPYYIAKELPIELSKSVTRWDQPERRTYNARDIVVGAWGDEYPFNFAVMHEYSHRK